jgi:hypothetical protein
MSHSARQSLPCSLYGTAYFHREALSRETGHSYTGIRSSIVMNTIRAVPHSVLLSDSGGFDDRATRTGGSGNDTAASGDRGTRNSPEAARIVPKVRLLRLIGDHQLGGLRGIAVERPESPFVPKRDLVDRIEDHEGIASGPSRPTHDLLNDRTDIGTLVPLIGRPGLALRPLPGRRGTRGGHLRDHVTVRAKGRRVVDRLA